MVLDLNKKTFLVVTGASRGIGHTMAIQFASKIQNGSVVVLLARNKQRLDQTKSIIDGLTNKQLKVQTFELDLETAKAQLCSKFLLDALTAAREQAGHFERAIIIHNAGSVGDVSKRASNVADTSAWTRYFNTNLFATVALNCEFFRIFARIPKLVINISSKCGIEPFASMAYYCAGKAARDMYFRVLALEEPDSIVLNYAPGAIDTDMTVLIQQESINQELADSFRQQRESKTMLTTEMTTKKLIKLLEEGTFKSGDHVDYWD